MTEDEAKQWLAERGWLAGEIGARLRWLATEIVRESEAQNLISAGSREVIWARHIVDSAQLLEITDAPAGARWLDIGSGAGFPGLVLACITAAPIRLIEPRPLRVAHLERCVDALALAHCTVVRGQVEALDLPRADVITARAYAPLAKIFATARHAADLSTIWVLPKGRNAENDLALARQAWHGAFHVKRSVTDPEARIIVARGVARLAPVQGKMRRGRGKQA